MNWKIVVLILVKVLETITSLEFKNLLTETKELFQVIRFALSDGKITREEIQQALKEGEDVLDSIKAVTQLIAKS